MQSLSPTVFVVDRDAGNGSWPTSAIRNAGWAPVPVASARALLAMPPAATPSCVLMQLSVREADGFDQLHRIAIDRAGTPAIVVSAPADIRTAVRAMQAGAFDLLTEPAMGDELLPAIGRALAFSEAKHRQEGELYELRARHLSLSYREQEVMVQVVNGLLNKQVAAQLHISEVTVKAHRGNVMRKMGADSLAALVTMAVLLNIQPLPIAPMTASFLSRVSATGAPSTRHIAGTFARHVRPHVRRRVIVCGVGCRRTAGSRVAALLHQGTPDDHVR